MFVYSMSERKYEVIWVRLRHITERWLAFAYLWQIKKTKTKQMIILTNARMTKKSLWPQIRACYSQRLKKKKKNWPSEVILEDRISEDPIQSG